jgi:hypothetical protein
MSVGRRFERTSASASARGVGVVDAKSRPCQPVLEIHCGSLKEFSAVGIYIKADLRDFDDFIPILGMIKCHAVLHSGATTRFHEDAQPFGRVLGLFLVKGLNLFDRSVGYRDHRMVESKPRLVLIKGKSHFERRKWSFSTRLPIA